MRIMSSNEIPREELLTRVKSALAARTLTGVPNSFGFAGSSRLFFLGVEKETGSLKPRTSLYWVRIPDRSVSQSSVPASQWNSAVGPIEEALENLDKSHVMSKEEQLSRERKRMVSVGITNYVLHDRSSRVLIPASGRLFVKNLAQDDAITEICVNAAGSGATSSPRSDFKWSPDGSMVAFIRDGDIYVLNPSSTQVNELRITYTHARCPGGTLTAGVAEFIMQEEFDRFTGYWWSPEKSPVYGGMEAVAGRVWRMLYMEVDESGVPVIRIPRYGDGTAPVALDDYRYPRAGDPNVKTAMCLAELCLDASSTHLSQTRVVLRRLRPPLEERFPWMEYVVRVGWMPDGSRVWAQLLNRKQQRLALVSFSLDEFAPEDDSSMTTPASSPPQAAPAPADASLPPSSSMPDPSKSILREEHTHIWVNVTELLSFLSDGSGRFIWGSESTGFRHLYLISPPSSSLNPSDPSCRPITRGSGWQVDGECLYTDESRQLVYFAGTRDSPLEKHLYVASYAPNANPDHIQRLTAAGFTHSFAVNSDCSLFVAVSSNITTKHFTAVYAISHPEPPSDPTVLASTTPLLPTAVQILVISTPPRVDVGPPIPLAPVTVPEMFTFKNKDGVELQGVVFKPPNYVPGTRYPTVLHVYGGPHVQVVSNDYRMTASSRNQLMASLGYMTVMVDGHGSWRRGLEFEGALRNRMGQVEIADQVDGLLHLVALGMVDPLRIAVTGWSYGGYLSLMALAQRPDIFKVALPGAGVTYWEAYDSGYTERYMDTPANNPEGYKLGSVLNYIQSIPDTEGRLFITHGAMDENVHFVHATALLNSLTIQNKPYALHVYPKERHGLRDPAAQLHLEMAFVNFLFRNL
mmetsp:Transcript_20072/g.32933  ORF Transcript_20072/g.32933 Transcript_20072/m.32933 type:complete len:861 (+) Transcript_20072:128-2710(+)